MFVVGNILVSDDLLDAPFACSLGHCLGSCCVHGVAGAPLEADERAQLEEVLPAVRPYLRPEALAVIDRAGVWEEDEDEPGHYVTTCVGQGECVFVVYEHGVAQCAVQKAYRAGEVSFEKPISCHLYPIRILRYGQVECLNYEQIPLCDPGRSHGGCSGTQLVDFLKPPLIRRYGAAWYAEFHAIWEALRVEQV